MKNLSRWKVTFVPCPDQQLENATDEAQVTKDLQQSTARWRMRAEEAEEKLLTFKWVVDCILDLWAFVAIIGMFSPIVCTNSVYTSTWYDMENGFSLVCAIITSTTEVERRLFSTLSVCLWAWYLKKLWTGWVCDENELIRFLVGICIRIQ